MTITIKLFASLRKHLPAGSQGGKALLELPDGATLQVLIDQMQLPPSMCHLTMINGAHQKDWSAELADGAEVSIFPPVAGGRQSWHTDSCPETAR